MTRNREDLESKRETGVDGFDRGRRRAVRKIAIGVGALAGLSLLPEQWTRPVIGHIVLPAHAATSGEVAQPTQSTTGCSLANGCYEIISSTGSLMNGQYIIWPGGGTSSPVSASVAVDCTSSGSSYDSVIATSLAQANNIFGTSSVTYAEARVNEMPGCTIYLLIN